jgi:hypothetical protein
LTYVPDTDSPDILTFKINDSPFDRVDYYIDKKSDRVTHLRNTVELFDGNYKNRYGDKYLYDKLVENFGAPTSSPQKGYNLWIVGNKKWNLIMTDRRSYVLLPYPEVLAIWPQ